MLQMTPFPARLTDMGRMLNFPLTEIKFLLLLQIISYQKFASPLCGELWKDSSCMQHCLRSSLLSNADEMRCQYL